MRKKNKNTTNKFELVCKDKQNNSAYLKLPDYPLEKKIKSNAVTFSPSDIIKNYIGPDFVLDFDEEGKLISIEIIYF